MAQGSAAALCGLVFGPAILVLLATAMERNFAAWRIERRRFGTVSEYVAMRWLGRNPRERRRLAPREAAGARVQTMTSMSISARARDAVRRLCSHLMRAL